MLVFLKKESSHKNGETFFCTDANKAFYGLLYRVHVALCNLQTLHIQITILTWQIVAGKELFCNIDKQVGGQSMLHGTRVSQVTKKTRVSQALLLWLGSYHHEEQQQQHSGLGNLQFSINHPSFCFYRTFVLVSTQMFLCQLLLLLL